MCLVEKHNADISNLTQKNNIWLRGNDCYSYTDKIWLIKVQTLANCACAVPVIDGLGYNWPAGAGQPSRSFERIFLQY